MEMLKSVQMRRRFGVWTLVFGFWSLAFAWSSEAQLNGSTPNMQ